MQLSIGIIATAVLVIIVGAVLLVRFLKQPVIPAERAIPAETAWVIRFNQPAALWERVHQTNAMAREALNFAWFRALWENTSRLDSIVHTEAEILENCRQEALLLCCRYLRNGNPEYLYLMNLPDAHQENFINKFISKVTGQDAEILPSKTSGRVLFRFRNRNGDVFFVALPDGIFMLSESENYLESALEQLQHGKGLASDPRFAEVRKTTGLKVDANVYFRLDQLPDLLAGQFQGSSRITSMLAQTGNWAGMDMNIRSDELWLSGYMNADKGDYLDLFRGEVPQKTELPRLLPFNTALMFSFSTDRMERLSQKMNQLHSGDTDAGTGRPTAADKSDVDETFSWIGREAALFITETAHENAEDNTFGIFEIHNRERAQAFLTKHSLATEERSSAPNKDSLSIRQMDQPALFSRFLGSSFRQLQAAYYVMLDHHVVFGRKPESLNRYLASILSGKTLERNENYQAFAAKVSDKASACLYVNIRKSIGFLRPLLAAKAQQSIQSLTPSLKNFQAFAIQITPEANMLYVHLYLRYNPSYKDENPAVWETQLDTTAACSPVILRGAPGGKTRIAVYDAGNQLYFLDVMGRIQRKVKIPGTIKGPLKVVQNPARKEACLLFNTAQAIYLLDLEGQSLPGFPVIGRFPVTNEVIAVDYAHNGDFRLLFACDDHRVYNYTGRGKPTPGWQPPRIPASVYRPLTYLRMLNKDYIIVADALGRAHFFDRQGRRAFAVKEAGYRMAETTPFFCYEDGPRSRIITLDHKGRVLRFGADGRWESLSLGPPEAFHSFLFADFNGDGHKDYMLASASRVMVYNSSKKRLGELMMPQKVRPGLFPIHLSAKAPIFGMVSENGEFIYLFSSKGWLAMNKDLHGITDFSTKNLGGSKYQSLLTSYRNFIFNYYLYELSFIAD